MSKKIKLVLGSTRQGRVGLAISEWLVGTAKEVGIDIEVLDLKEINLPMFDAPVPPMYGPTQTEEGKKWQATVAEAKSFVFLTPEYNKSIPGSLKNAIDYLYTEWNDKPAAIVSYGYMDGGGTATNHLNDIFSLIKLNNVGEKMAIQLTQETFNENGQFNDIDASLDVIKSDFLKTLESLSN